MIAWAGLATALGLMWYLVPGSAQTDVEASVAAQVASRLVGGHIVFWAAFALALGASALSGDRRLAADAFLCRGLSRLGYFIIKALARVAIAWMLLLILVLPLTFLAHGTLPGEISFAGLATSLLMTAGILTCLILLSQAIGVWFDNPLVCVATSCMVVYGLGIILSLLQLEAVAPTIFIQHLSSSIHGQHDAVYNSSLLPLLSTITLLVLGISLTTFAKQDI